jgi:hypothetical protein
MFWTKAWPAAMTACGAISLQSTHRPEPRLQTAMVGLDGVVRMDPCAVQGRRDHLVEHSRVETVPVGGDLDGQDLGSVERPGEEAPSRCAVAAR